MSKGQWAQTAQAHNKSIYHFYFNQKMRCKVAVSKKQNSGLTEEVWCITDFEIFWRVWKKVNSFSDQSEVLL